MDAMTGVSGQGPNTRHRACAQFQQPLTVIGHERGYWAVQRVAGAVVWVCREAWGEGNSEAFNGRGE